MLTYIVQCSAFWKTCWQCLQTGNSEALQNQSPLPQQALHTKDGNRDHIWYTSIGSSRQSHDYRNYSKCIYIRTYILPQRSTAKLVTNIHTWEAFIHIFVQFWAHASYISPYEKVQQPTHALQGVIHTWVHPNSQFQRAVWHVRDPEMLGGLHECQGTLGHHCSVGEVQALWEASNQHIRVTNCLNLWPREWELVMCVSMSICIAIFALHFDQERDCIVMSVSIFVCIASFALHYSL